jgi:hypothetical protein
VFSTRSSSPSTDVHVEDSARLGNIHSFEIDFGDLSERRNDDGRADLVDSLYRTPTSFTLRSYIRLGNLV